MSLINSMKYLDCEKAVCGYLKQMIEAIEFPNPSGSGTFNVTARLEWPRNLIKAKMTAIFIESPGVRDSNDLANGCSIEESINQYEKDTILINYGEVEIPFFVTGWAPTTDVQDILISHLRRHLRSDQGTPAFLHYFNQPIQLQYTSFKRIQNAETAKSGLYIFEISGVGYTNDVMLTPINETEYQAETTYSEE